jgi:D-serine deaminase-like pyridoxal phosphate-dependent protein
MGGGGVVRIADLTTPALVVDADALEHNLTTMATALPGPRLRPHVKAHKCTELARRQASHGHRGFTCATIREVEGMAAAGLGDDLLLANEVLDASRLGRLQSARVTVAVDSAATIDAAARGGVREVLIDVNIGLPRCGCRPEDAARLADLARTKGLEVRGVMGYEGHATVVEDVDERRKVASAAWDVLAAAHAEVGGEVVSAGATVTYSFDAGAVTEFQAGSYALMDGFYGRYGLPFRQALSILATVISVAPDYAVCNAGLKALGMDHGNPAMADGLTPFIVSDEHITFVHDRPVTAGDLVSVIPAHVDPTVAYHERMHVVRGEDVLETWPVDLRGW